MRSLVKHQHIFWIAIVFLIGFTVISLNACNGHNKLSSLNKYIIQVKRQPAQPIPPIPNFKPYQSFNYNADNLRDPFIPLSNGILNSLIKGERVMEPLEMFSLDALHMVGTISIKDKIWALIAAPDGNIYRVSIGNYLGQNAGQVIAVSERAVQLIEKRSAQRPDKQNYQTRSVTLFLNEASAVQEKKAKKVS
jgi:type IV pilus assembly protein PilP